jgi:uncharacterized OsmC-like protein
MTLRMYANLKKIPLDHVRVELQHSRRHIDDCKGCDEKAGNIQTIERALYLEGDLSSEERERLVQIADKCPVHKTLHSNLQVVTTLKTTQ